jgi:glycosyltransferase involved in cell wall biosynthesis
MTCTTLYINGRFLTKAITGTQRFAWEILRSLDDVLPKEVPFNEVKILAPQGTTAPTGLARISFATVGRLQGHVWEQRELFRASRHGFLLNFCNSGPVLHPHQLTVIHDALVYRMPENYSRLYGGVHRTLGHILARRSKIATVSAFSRRELAATFRLNEAEIPIFPNGHEHSLGIEAEFQVLDRLGVQERPFFLFVGSPAPNKNLARALEAFSRLQRSEIAFVIVGAAKSNVFAPANLVLSPNVIMPGRLSDGEIVALYRRAVALVFPSLYEGFGIPPLEAMTLGCPVVAARIPPVEDVCGDAALYFDPMDPSAIAARMRDVIDQPSVRARLKEQGNMRFGRFSWAESSKAVYEILGRG